MAAACGILSSEAFTSLKVKRYSASFKPHQSQHFKPRQLQHETASCQDTKNNMHQCVMMPKYIICGEHPQLEWHHPQARCKRA